MVVHCLLRPQTKYVQAIWRRKWSHGRNPLRICNAGHLPIIRVSTCDSPPDGLSWVIYIVFHPSRFHRLIALGSTIGLFIYGGDRACCFFMGALSGAVSGFPSRSLENQQSVSPIQSCFLADILLINSVRLDF